MSQVLSRRTTLLGGVATVVGLAAAMTACDVDDLRPPDADAPVAPVPATPGGPTADESLVDEAAAAITTAMTAVSTGRTLPALRASLAPLARDHRRHLAALHHTGTSPSPSESPSESPADADADTALAAVRAAEQTLQQQLVGFAVRAESGTLAALLASMSASISQHAAVLG